jgi:probable rRNA maturation factor
VNSSSLAVEIQNVSEFEPLPKAVSIRSWVALPFSGVRRNGELTVRIVGAQESAVLNGKYRDKRGPTNVLAFPSDAPKLPGAELLPLGDIVICAEIVAREAAEQGKALEAHWAHVVIHGALHLMGYDHETDAEAERMEQRERELLAQLGFADPYADLNGT